MQVGFGAACGEQPPKVDAAHLRDAARSVQGWEAEVSEKAEGCWDLRLTEAMAMAQAVLGGRGLHLQCCRTSSLSARSLGNVRHLSAAGSFSVGSSRVSHESRRYVQLITASGATEKKEEPKRRPEMKLFSVALPILATIVVTQSTDTYYNNSVFIDTQNDWLMPEDMTKNLYMLISMVFCWGCCVFGSMNDPFYESDEYRGAGGNGTNHWIYEREEAEEQEAREELFREALVKEIEGKVEVMRELEQGADKEKELV